MRARHRRLGLLPVLVAALALTGPVAGQKATSSAPSAAAPSAAVPSATELDQLLAPVALYPDQLLAPMLMSASSPAKVGALHEWLASQSATGTALQDAAVGSGFSESFAALVLFPDVVAYMAGQSAWTARVGQAFTADRSAVFASIQRLRAKAKQAGNLKSTPQQSVETKTTTNGQQVIVIEPANPQIVYVPQYNPQVVYTQPTTVVVQQESSSNAAVAGIIGFTAGIAIGAAIDNDYYYGPYRYGGAYMYNDGWDDYYDAREDAREDWQDHREDIGENRTDRAENARDQRSERAGNAQDQRTERSGNASQQRTDRQQAAQTSGQQRTSAATTSQEARGHSGAAKTRERSGTGSDAFSGYSSGKSERAASSRGKSSRSSSRSGGSRRR